jgi:hypothetical protein
MSKGLRRVMLTSDSPQLTLLARLRVLRRRRGGEGGEQEGGARCTFYLFSIAKLDTHSVSTIVTKFLCISWRESETRQRGQDLAFSSSPLAAPWIPKPLSIRLTVTSSSSFSKGVLDIRTELGHLLVRPNEICVIPRGIRYNMLLPEGPVRGYALELYQGRYTLPNLGPLGSFGLANARDFQVPVALFDEDTENTYRIIAKFNNNLFVATQDHTQFDIVPWHGLYYPYKYDLGRFLTVEASPTITLIHQSSRCSRPPKVSPRWPSSRRGGS